jgi:hypothetical protein
MKSPSIRKFRLERLERREVLTSAGFDWVPALSEFPPAIAGNDFAPLVAEAPTSISPTVKHEPTVPPIQTWPTPNPTSPGTPSPGSYLPGVYLTADLTSSGATSGYASYQTTTLSTFQSVAFRVTVVAATPNSSLLVVVDDAIVGEVETDGTGYGTLLLTSSSSTSSFHAPPSVHAGSTISVGPLNGTFSANPLIRN